jgi:hypothetical protein
MAATPPSSDAFPHPALDPLSTNPGMPTYDSLVPLQKQINANSMSVASLGGDGQRGHLVQTMALAKYLVLTGGQNHLAPAHPGAVVIVPQPDAGGNPTAAMITEANRAHSEAVKVHELFHSTDKKLKQQLLLAIPRLCLAAHDNDDVGFANATTLTLLTHLWTTYGSKTADDYTANDKRLKTAWNTTDPIEGVWDNAKQCKLFDPNIPDAQIVRETATVIENTGLFTEDIKHWKRRTPQQQTMDQLKLDFNQANKERLAQTTTIQAGYQAAAVQALANQAPPAAFLAAPPAGTPMYYCWSHGLQGDPSHTSATCPNPYVNHNHAAVASNMLGGHNYIARHEGEVRLQVNPNWAIRAGRGQGGARGAGRGGRGGRG